MFNITDNQPGQWMQVDLGAGRSLVPNHYCLRHHTQSSNALRHWDLEGSDDANSWTTLRTHSDDQALAATPMSVAAWPVEGATKAFRYFRIRQTGKNSSDHDNLLCAGIELYGQLTTA